MTINELFSKERSIKDAAGLAGVPYHKVYALVNIELLKGTVRKVGEGKKCKYVATNATPKFAAKLDTKTAVETKAQIYTLERYADRKWSSVDTTSSLSKAAAWRDNCSANVPLNYRVINNVTGEVVIEHTKPLASRVA